MMKTGPAFETYLCHVRRGGTKKKPAADTEAGLINSPFDPSAGINQIRSHGR